MFKILLIECGTLDAIFLHRHLESRGVEIAVARTIEGAVACAKIWLPNLVLINAPSTNTKYKKIARAMNSSALTRPIPIALVEPQLLKLKTIVS